MNCFVFKTKKRTWTNKSTREALALGSGSMVRITRGNTTIEREVRRAPVAAARVLRAIQSASGLYGIGMTPYDMKELGVKVGDTVAVANKYIDVEPVQSRTSTSRSPMVETEGGSASGGSLKDRIKAMKIGDVITVSESQAKSGAYSVAKALGYKIRKVSATSIERISKQ